ncbi:MAG: tetratricopeptide repeat protein, partial [Kiritimatiellae bacterium]|nr:tetratricopeptide repeat protein [Kiritimatiellia bacterium]
LALKEYEAFLRNFPASKKLDVIHFRLGECNRSLGKSEAAEKEYDFVFKNSASEYRFKAGFKRAELFASMGKTDMAMELFRGVIKENPPPEVTSAGMYHLGELLFTAGKTNDAIKTLEQLKSLYPKSEFYNLALLKLGEIYGKDPAKEKDALQFYSSVAAKPASPRMGAEALFQIAELHFRHKAYEKSAEAYRKLIAEYPSDPRSVEGRIQAAWAEHNAGLYADALRIAEDGLKGNLPGEKVEWLYLKANCERQLTKNEDAVRSYSQILTQHPNSNFENAARYETALTFYKMGKCLNAIREAEKLQTVPEMKKDIYWLLAESFSVLKEFDSAIQYYRLIVKEFPASDMAADAAYKLAHHLQTKGEYQEAARHYATVAGNFPQTKLAPQALYASAFCLVKVKMNAEALRDWTTLVQKYPNDPLVEEALYQRAILETRMRKDKEALESFRELLKKFPKTKFASDAHYWQGMFLSDQKKWQDAEEEFRQSLKKSPAKELEREAQFTLAAVLQKTGKFDESATLLQSLVASPIRDKIPSELVRWLSEYMFDRKKYAESVAAAQILLFRNSEPEWQQTGWCLVGRTHYAEGDMKAAENAFKKALEVKVTTGFAAEAAVRLGDITFRGKNFEESAKNYERAARLASDESMLGVRARAYAGLGRSAKARSDLDNAARYFMSVAVLYNDAELVSECLFEAADAYVKIGKKDESSKAVKELLERYPDSAWAKKPEIAKLR